MGKLRVMICLVLLIRAGNAGVLRIPGSDNLGEITRILSENVSENKEALPFSPPSNFDSVDHTVTGLLDANGNNASMISTNLSRLFENIDLMRSNLGKIEEVMQWIRDTEIGKAKKDLQYQRTANIVMMAVSIPMTLAIIYLVFVVYSGLGQSDKKSQVQAEFGMAIDEK